MQQILCKYKHTLTEKNKLTNTHATSVQTGRQGVRNSKSNNDRLTHQM